MIHKIMDLSYFVSVDSLQGQWEVDCFVSDIDHFP